MRCCFFNVSQVSPTPSAPVEQLRQQRRDQRAVHELRRHGVVAAFLEALADLLELPGTLAIRLVQRAEALGFFLDARQIRAHDRELIHGRVVVGRRRAVARSRKLRIVSPRSASRTISFARRERSSSPAANAARFSTSASTRRLVLLDSLVDGGERFAGLLEVFLALRNLGRLGRGSLERVHGREVLVALAAHALSHARRMRAGSSVNSQ